MHFQVPPRLLLFFLLSCCGFTHAQIPTFGDRVRATGILLAVEKDDFGHFFLGGAFEDFNGDSSSVGLIKLTGSASKDPLWDIENIAIVSDLLVLGDFLYVGGTFTSISTFSNGTLPIAHLARIHLSGPNEGKVDTTWTPQLNGSVNLLATGAGGVIAEGNFSSVNGASRGGMASIPTSNGAEVNSFNPSPSGVVKVITNFRGHIYVGGTFSSIGGIQQPFLARLNSLGGVDTTWLPDLNGSVSAIEGSVSDLYVGGSYTRVEQIPHRGIARFDVGPSGVNFDMTWAPDPDGEVTSIIVSGNTLYIAGVFLEVDEVARPLLARISATDGSVFTGFSANVNGGISDMIPGAGGILAVGQFTTGTGSSTGAFASFSGATGNTLSSFRGRITTSGQVFTMEPTGDGGVYIGGLFDEVDGVPRTSLARINSDGSLNTGFVPQLVGANRLVNDIELDGSFLYVAGDFFKASGLNTFNAAKLGANSGAASSSFVVKAFSPLKSVAVLGSRVYFGGENLRFVTNNDEGNEINVANLVRFDKNNGQVDVSWTPLVSLNGNPAGAAVNAIEVGGGGIIIGGRFTFITDPQNTATAFQRVNLCALSTGGWGQPLPGWGSIFFQANGDFANVNRLLLHNDSVYAAGDFATINDVIHVGIGKFNTAGGGWDSGFDVSPVSVVGGQTIAEPVETMAASGSSIFVGGSFDFVLGETQYEFNPEVARVDQDTGIPDLSWYPYPSSSVSEITFSGSKLWMYGSYGFIGDFATDGLVALTDNSESYLNYFGQFYSGLDLENSDLISPVVDTDGDGLSNLLEAAFNLNPSVADGGAVSPGGSSGFPVLGPDMIGGQRFMTMEFVRFKGAQNSGISVTPEFSSDLESFSARGVEVSVQSVSATHERVLVRDSQGNLPEAFIRYRVENE